MIATHSVKSLDSRLKQEAIRARPFSKVPSVFLSSDLLSLKFFAAPLNAADIKDSRFASDMANAEYHSLETVGVNLPNITDGRIKQVLVPYHNDYCAITPVPSLAMIDAINESYPASYFWHIVQPVKAGATNHGDPVASKVGQVKLLDNWLPKALPDTHSVKTDSLVFLITARVENMNVSSSYVSSGLPALTGISGYVHVLERETGLNLPFGFGIKNLGSVREGKLGTNYSSDTPKAKLHKRAMIANELTASADVAIVLKVGGARDSALLLEAIKKVNRLCGGAIFDIHAGLASELPPYFWYQRDSDPFKPVCFQDFIISHNHGIKLIQSGYAFLELPTQRENARSRLHAWAEPIFSLIEIGDQPDFFKLKQTEFGVVWG